MAGGTFLVQNKVRAGAYIRFRSVKQSFAAVGSRGIAALPLKLGFGPVGTLVEVNADTDIRKTFGYDPSDTELLLLRECAKRAQTVLVYRLADGQKASCTAENLTVTARYGGSGGNRMTVRVSGEEAPFLVETFLDGTLVHSQSAGEISQLVSNDWVEFSGSGALQPHAGIVLSGGSDGEVTTQSYDSFFARFKRSPSRPLQSLPMMQKLFGLLSPLLNLCGKMRGILFRLWSQAILRPIMKALSLSKTA